MELAFYGARPHHPSLYRIPAVGVRPLHFSAIGLPTGLTLDASSGIISGTARDRGTYVVHFYAQHNFA
jgi:alpha-galactosidase